MGLKCGACGRKLKVDRVNKVERVDKGLVTEILLNRALCLLPTAFSKEAVSRVFDSLQRDLLINNREPVFKIKKAPRLPGSLSILNILLTSLLKYPPPRYPN